MSGPSNKKGYFRHHVFCCTNKRGSDDSRGCCIDGGGGVLRNHMKATAKQMDLAGVRINAAGCLDRCQQGPVLVVYPEGVWYAVRTTADIDEILESHLRDGIPVKHLML